MDVFLFFVRSGDLRRHFSPKNFKFRSDAHNNGDGINSSKPTIISRRFFSDARFSAVVNVTGFTLLIVPISMKKPEKGNIREQEHIRARLLFVFVLKEINEKNKIQKIHETTGNKFRVPK
ncbi:MAG: hypothetical protein FD181_3485 [Prolixibacteraceae bacterium]|nr:MAG: hypothetical protein FD181_3485 [Prolixibacteraceae bacterium]